MKFSYLKSKTIIKICYNEGVENLLSSLEKRQTSFFIIIFFIVGFLLYAHGLSNDFIWDDAFQIVNNNFIHNASHVFSLFGASTFDSGGGSLPLFGIYYKPFMSLFFLLTYVVWGPNPFWFHLGDLIFHIVNTILIFLLLRHLFAKISFSFSRSPAFILSVIFLIHPANVEAVAYISSTQELLYVFFLLLSILTTIRYVEKKQTWVIFFTIQLLQLCALFSKESGVLAPLLVCTYILIFRRSYAKRFLIGSFGVILLYFFFRFGLAQIPLVIEQSSVPIHKASLLIRIQTIPYEIFSYLRLLSFPKDLFILQHDVVKSVFDWRFYIALPFASLAVILFFFLTFKKINPVKLFFSFWMLFGIGMILNIIPLDMTIAERWLYGPMIGMLGWIGIVFGSLSIKSKQYQVTLFIAFLIIILFFFVRSFIRIGDWQTQDILATHDIHYEKESDQLFSYYATALLNEGNIEESKKFYLESIKLYPKQSAAYTNLGLIYFYQNNFKASEYYLLIAIQNNPNTTAYKNYLILLFHENRWQEAYKVATNALSIFPNSPVLQKQLARIFVQEGKLDFAKIHAQKAVELDPSQDNQDFLHEIEASMSAQTP